MMQEFLMTQEEMDDIISINKNMPPVMKFGDYWSGMDLEEKINHYWETLGKKYGFKPLTARPSSKSHLHFLAEPAPIEVPKTQSEIEIDKYIQGGLPMIIEQLEKCGYETEAGFLTNNIAFIALKQMAIS